MNKNQIRITLSGSIGVGKTTLMNLLDEIYLDRGLSVAVCNEPAIDKINKEVLQYSIKNPKDKEFNTHFQLYLLGQKLGILQTLLSNYKDYDIIIQDRDIKEDYLFFNQIKSKSLVYETQIDKIMNSKKYSPSLRIYLKTNTFETQRSNYFSREKFKKEEQMKEAIKYLQRVNKSYDYFEQQLIDGDEDYVILVNDGESFNILNYRIDNIPLMLDIIDVLNTITDTFTLPEDFNYSEEKYNYSPDETLGREPTFVDLYEFENKLEHGLLKEVWEDYNDFDEEYDEDDFWD